jgi:hypothetical protein
MNEHMLNWCKGILVFLAAFGLACFANVACYFWLSSGFGVIPVNDGVVGMGFPFVMLERGGYDGREEFYEKAAAANLLVAVCFGALATAVWRFRKWRSLSIS